MHHRRAGDAVIDEHARVVRGEGKGHRLARRDVPEGRAGRHPGRVKIERVRHRPAVVERDLDGLTLPHVQHRSGNPPVEGPSTKVHAGRDLDRAILDRDREASNRAAHGRRQMRRERHERRTPLRALEASDTLARLGGASRRPQQGAGGESTKTTEQHAPAGLRHGLQEGRLLQRVVRPFGLSVCSGVHVAAPRAATGVPSGRRVCFPVSEPESAIILLKTFSVRARSR